MPVALPSPAHPPLSIAEQYRDLPAPVALYLLRALGVELRPVASVQIKQVGTLRTDADSARWLAFRALHSVWPQLRQFHWDARIRLAPLLHLRVRDAYADGAGQGRVHLWSWLKLAADRGVPELNAGALHRFLAEAPWYPSALLPSAGVRWHLINETRALATLEDAGSVVSLEFGFDANGDVESIYTPHRWRRVGRAYRRCGWEGHFSDYREQQGLRVPLRAEVGWLTEGRLDLVWRGEVTSLEYQFAQVEP